MKKVILSLAVVAAFGFGMVACDDSNKNNANDTDTVVACEDSTEACEDTTKACEDTTAVDTVAVDTVNEAAPEA